MPRNNTHLEEWFALFEDSQNHPCSIANKAYYTLSNTTVYPSEENVFAAFELTPPKSVKVVLIGQDPYHTPGQAQGLAFSLPKDAKTQPSMRNILKELSDDIGGSHSQDLTDWAEQGVLLLNTSLTVEEGKPNSMSKLWAPFTKELIQKIASFSQPIVFILWGNHAQKYLPLIEGKKDYLVSAHPSPFSVRRGFFGSRPFSETNALLKQHGLSPIIWSEN